MYFSITIFNEIFVIDTFIVDNADYQPICTESV